MTQEKRENTTDGIWTVREQTIYDKVSGLIIQFVVGNDGFARLRLFGNLPNGNREIGFGTNGYEGFAGTLMGSGNPFEPTESD